MAPILAAYVDGQGRDPDPVRASYDYDTDVLTLYGAAAGGVSLMDVLAHEGWHKLFGRNEDAARAAGHDCAGEI